MSFRQYAGFAAATTVALFAAAFFAASVISGCGKAPEKKETTPAGTTAPSEEGAAVTAEAGKITVETKKGEVATIEKTGEGEAKMTVKGPGGKETTIQTATDKKPADFPSDFQLYENSKKSFVRVKDEENVTFTVSLETSDSESKVKDFYQKALSENDYKLVTTMAMPSGTMYQFEKGKRISGAVTISAKGGKTTAAVSLSLQKGPK